MLMDRRVTSTYLWPFKEDVIRFDFELDNENEKLWMEVANGLIHGTSQLPE
jgi:hypothetical protein